MPTSKNCSDCGATFNPSSEGIVGGKVAFCTDCCRKDPAESTCCVSCGLKVTHVDTANGWCDSCHDDFRVFNDMADQIANGATFMES